MMRIGYDARYINDRYHGIGRYAYQLLASLIEKEHQHTFLIFHGKWLDSRFDWGALSRQPNVEMCAGPWPLYWPQEQLVWPRLIKKHRVDLFHSPTFVAPLLSSLLTSPLPVITTVHDLIFDRNPEYMPRRWMRPYYQSMMKLSIQRASIVVTVSQHTSTDLVRFYNPPEEKIVTIPEGVDPIFRCAKVESNDQLALERYGVKKPYILSVGARRPHKNLARLVEAYASLSDSVPHSLVLVGAPDRRFEDEALERTRTYNLENKVVFLDWVPDADLLIIYKQADLVVLPSMIEGFGLPALEAMACGIPVAAAGNSSMTEVAGEAGLYFDPLDTKQIAGSMAEILNNPEVRLRMKKAGLERSAEFNWESTAAAISSIYNRLI